jgi:alkylation response protein AidB-like acyl-CoA dehydrogenase
MIPLLNDRDIAFQLYEVLDTEALLARAPYADHSRAVFDATLATARTVAEKYFANHNAKGDANEPSFDGERVHLIPETRAAWEAFVEAGFLAAHETLEEGGAQLPEVIFRVVMAYIDAANISTAAYPFITIGVINLLRAFGSAEQKARYLPLLMSGRANGTMALTEPAQGSALGDIKVTAEPAADGSYRLFGQKMFISCADHDITGNVIHMVLAKIRGAPPGVKGISLFIVPKYLVGEDGSPGARNDVAVAGLNHKMGYRNATNTVLNFGERDGAVGYLVGEPHQGLGYMFQMMNEARIGIGLGAAAIAYQGYNLSLDYARNRPQGRLPSCSDPTSPQVMLVEHADVRRLLLAQKVYAEGGLFMCLYASSLFEDQHSAPDPGRRERAALLLDLITPIVKSWPSRYGCLGNDHAIQILGGAGYMREYGAEQLYRDQRLNPIHEGAEAIHGIDLLGRKVRLRGGAGHRALLAAARADIARAAERAATADFAAALEAALQVLDETTAALLEHLAGDIDLGMANATLYLDLYGRVVAAWLWLKQALAADAGLARDPHPADCDFYRGKLHAARYCFEWELPQIHWQAQLLRTANRVPFEMQDAWF